MSSTTDDRTARLAELHERRAFLLRSLDDLDREKAAGDLSDADYELLHHDYTRRAADVLRQIESGTAPSGPGPGPATRGLRGGRGAAVGGVVVMFALGAGILVARTAGERKGASGLTGTVSTAAPGSRDAKVETLLQQGRDNLGSDPLTSLKAFDQASELDPTKVEAFAYAGWVLRIVAQSVSDPAQKKELLDGARRRLDRAIGIDPRYPDARAFRGVLELRDENDPKAALRDFVALEQLNPPAEVEQLVAGARRDAEDAVAATTVPKG